MRNGLIIHVDSNLLSWLSWHVQHRCSHVGVFCFVFGLSCHFVLRLYGVGHNCCKRPFRQRERNPAAATWATLLVSGWGWWGGGAELFTCPYPLKVQTHPPREQTLATQTRASGRHSTIKTALGGGGGDWL